MAHDDKPEIKGSTAEERRSLMNHKGAPAAPLLLAILLALNMSGQEKLREDVTVTLVEIPVRVLLKGRPVKDLSREDFKLYENGVEQEISRFQIISRRIEDRPGPEQPGETPRLFPRLFLLMFNIYDYEPAVGTAIDDFFRDVFRSGDSILILTEDRILNAEPGLGVEDYVRGLKDALINFKFISTRSTQQNFSDLDFEADRLLLSAQSGGGPGGISSFDHALVQFYEKYLHIWEVYRSQFLLPDLDFFELLLRKIRSFEGEKWAICFQQRELFPVLKNASRLETAIRSWMDSQVDPQDQVKARLVRARQEDLRRSFDLSASFSPELLSDLFLGADMTFHLILLKSSRTVFSQNFELGEVGQDFEAMLKKVSASTGGHTAFSNRPSEVLKEAAALEDYHYLLVYSPAEDSAERKRTVEVRVARQGVEVSYLRMPRGGGPPLIAVAKVATEGRSLSFSLDHGQMVNVDGTRRGSAAVKIILYNEATEKVFDEGRTIDLTRESVRVSLNFDRLEPGNFFLIIEARDLVSGATDVYNGNIRLAAPRRTP